MHFNRIQFIGLAAAALVALGSCAKSYFDSRAMNEHAEHLQKTRPFRYPLDEYFPETPVTDSDPPKTERRERHHSAEDSFAPAGTPVYAIGDGIISYSGKMGG